MFRFAESPRVRLAAAWVACLLLAAQRWHHARTIYGPEPDAPPEQHRADGNNGHVQIDFGGQWLMGRMIAAGHGRELYHRNRHWEVFRAALPRAAESEEVRRYAFPQESRPKRLKEEETRHDVEDLMMNTMGRDSPRWDEFAAAIALPFAATAPFDAAIRLAETERRVTPELITELGKPTIGGPLYPPVHALLYSPLGLLPPQQAYHLFQLFSVLLAIVCGRLARVVTNGKLSTPVAATCILLFPGCRTGIDLAQNHVLTLAVVLGGWALAARDRPFRGGMVWGLLAFKPVWGLAFAVVPLLLGRWRFLCGLAVGGCSLVLLTLPVVGVQGWLDWLAVGKEAAAVYDVNERWIGKSRDLAGIVRRPLLDFGVPEAERGSVWASRLSWLLWAAVSIGTVAVHRLRRHNPEATAFLLLGAVLACYRFMFYDLLLASVAFVALANSWRPRTVRAFATSFVGVIFLLLLIHDNMLLQLNLKFTFGLGNLPRPGEALPYRHVSYATDYDHPTDTLLLLALWTGLAVKLLRQPRSASSAAPMSDDRMSDSPTSTA